MSECTHDCSTCGESCGERTAPQSFLKEKNPAARVGKIFGVVSGKGGVGKSMVTSQLAVLMRRKGYNVGILDADVTGPSIPKAFGVHDRAMGDERGMLPVETEGGIQMISVNLLLDNETDPVLWRGPVIGGVVTQFWTDVVWDVDYLFVDMPPGTGDVALSVFQSLPLDGVIIVASPQELVSMVVPHRGRGGEHELPRLPRLRQGDPPLRPGQDPGRRSGPRSEAPGPDAHRPQAGGAHRCGPHRGLRRRLAGPGGGHPGEI